MNAYSCPAWEYLRFFLCNLGLTNALGTSERSCWALLPAHLHFWLPGSKGPQLTLQHGGLSFAPHFCKAKRCHAGCMLHFRNACACTLTVFPNCLHKCYLWRLSWAEWTVRSHTSDVLPSSIKTNIHTYIWCNICLQENASSGRNAIKLF